MGKQVKTFSLVVNMSYLKVFMVFVLVMFMIKQAKECSHNTTVTKPPKSLLDSVSNICEAERGNSKIKHIICLIALLTLTTPDDLKPLATQEASLIAARLNLIEKAINDLKTPKCE